MAEEEETKEEKVEESPEKEEKTLEADDSEKKETKKEEPKKKTVNWPLRDIKEPHEHDVLYGRGGGTNHHPGNKRYRKMVEERKLDYVNSKRLDKPLVALEIIREWRGQDPPGRFLKLDEKSGMWHDVGDKKAREKTSQALREKAPQIRKQQEELSPTKSEGDETIEEEKMKNTRFASGTKSGNSKTGVKRAVLARDHSLGREYVSPGDTVTLEGFSWEEGLSPSGSRVSSGQYGAGSRTSSSSMGGQAPQQQPPYNGRTGSASYRTPSQGSATAPPPPPPPPDYYDARQRNYSGQSQYSGQTRFESWGSISSGPAMPPPPMPYAQYPYDRSGSGYDYTPPYTAIQREHSLQGNALRGASVTHSASPDCFAQGGWNDGSGGGGGGPPPAMPPPGGMSSSPWPSQGQPPPQIPPPPPPPRYQGGGEPSPRYQSGGEPPVVRYQSGGEPPRYQSGSDGRYNRSPTNPTSPTQAPGSPYNVDPEIARTWSNQSEDYEKAANMIGESLSPPPPPVKKSMPTSPIRRSPPSSSDSTIPRPKIVKRHTSNQNETVETKPDLSTGGRVKRAALNRDNSLASNRLKAAYPVGGIGKDIFDTEMRSLSTSMELSSLESSVKPPQQPSRPKPLSAEARISTIDKIAMDLFVTKPEGLKASNRSSTLDALFDDDALLGADGARERLRTSSTDAFLREITQDGPPKPGAITAEARVSTMDSLLGDTTIEAPLDITRGVSVSEWLKE